MQLRSLLEDYVNFNFSFSFSVSMSSWRRTRFVEKPVYIPVSGSALNLEVVSKNYTSNGTDTITPSIDYDGIARVEVEIDVPVRFTGLGVVRGSGRIFTTFMQVNFSATPTYSSNDPSSSVTYDIAPGHALFYVETGNLNNTIDDVRQAAMSVAMNFTESTQSSYNIRGAFRAWDVQIPSIGSGTLYMLFTKQGNDPVLYSTTQGGLTTGLTFLTLYTDITNLVLN